uniref:Uncharacterized protein n=1 Tax=Cannabis sativa TaxID=3483 RepID=A0A803PTC9_CANSA
ITCTPKLLELLSGESLQSSSKSLRHIRDMLGNFENTAAFFLFGLQQVKGLISFT